MNENCLLEIVSAFKYLQEFVLAQRKHSLKLNQL